MRATFNCLVDLGSFSERRTASDATRGRDLMGIHDVLQPAVRLDAHTTVTKRRRQPSFSDRLRSEHDENRAINSGIIFASECPGSANPRGGPVRVSTALSRRCAAALLLTLSLAVPAAAGDGSAIRIDNFGRVDATYYRGAQPKGQDYGVLASLGVRAVVNLTSDDADAAEKADAERAGMRYFQIPMTTHEAPTAEQIATFLAIVADPANEPVYVHCVGGRHRTGVMTAVYRMAHHGWDAARAFAEMKQYRFGADFLHAEFKRFVFAYPAQLAHTRAAATAAAGG